MITLCCSVSTASCASVAARITSAAAAVASAETLWLDCTAVTFLGSRCLCEVFFDFLDALLLAVPLAVAATTVAAAATGAAVLLMLSELLLPGDAGGIAEAAAATVSVCSATVPGSDRLQAAFPAGAVLASSAVVHT
jgi:anti-anti-sigma regulatory factor